MNTKNIYLDCDEVLLDSSRTAADFLRERYGLDVDRKKYPSDWDVSRSPFKKWQEIADQFIKTDQFAHLPLMPGAKEGIEALKNMGYSLYVVTSISDDEEVYRKRKHNLDALFGSTMFESITCLPMELDNKGKYYGSVPTGIVIDDALHNLVTAQKCGHQAILMAVEQNVHRQEEARAKNIPIHKSLVDVALYLKSRERS